MSIQIFYDFAALSDCLGYNLSLYGDNAAQVLSNSIYESNPYTVIKTKEDKYIKHFPRSLKWMVFDTEQEFHEYQHSLKKLERDPETGRLLYSQDTFNTVQSAS